MILKKMITKYSGNYRKMFGFGMMFLCVGILLQQISAYLSNLADTTPALIHFISGLLLGMAAVFIVFSIYLNVKSFKIYRQTNAANPGGEE